MKEKGSPQRTSFSFLLYIVFFVGVIITATTSILLYLFMLEKTESDVVTAVVTTIYLVVLAFVLTLVSVIYRGVNAEKPVKKILEATDKMAKGDFDIRLKPRHSYGRYDEYDIISENLSRMAKELSKAEVLRSDFIANVSHEIKTPLAVIQNYAAELKDGGLDEDARRECCDILISASARLTSLVTNILKLNKLENQSIFPSKTKVDVAEQLRVCVLSFEDRIESKNLGLECDIEECSVVSDGGLLEIIWNNLLSNAVKFTDEGRIYVSLKDEGECAAVCVKDTGCGMDAETGSRIFDKFYQGDTSRAQEGNGLGLALVKRVIDILGGQISVDSKPGCGAVFTVRIKKE
ncbi:MAG: HAMP domain-containing histidine kinase [Clostridia bacterium]|nr:HAMP domain-containing histidine kinase [Clostridia bacterium]